MIEAVKIWNEPNNKSHWDPNLDPEWDRFARMCTLTGQAIRAEHPTLPRVLGGMSPIDPFFVRRLTGKGALDHVDALAVHGFPLDWNLWQIDEWPAKLAEIEQTGGGPHCFVLFDDAEILHRHHVPGKRNHPRAERHVAILCGRYEGFDDRVHAHLADDEVSIGRYVLASGELPAMVLADVIMRKLPGALGHAESAAEESYSQRLEGMPEYPHYTRPPLYRGWGVPEVLLSGDHEKVRAWRLEQSRIRAAESESGGK